MGGWGAIAAGCSRAGKRRVFGVLWAPHTLPEGVGYIDPYCAALCVQSPYQAVSCRAVLCRVVFLQEQLHSWMVDKQGRDQFVIKHGDEVVVLWNDGRRCRADEAYKRAFWTGAL